MVDQLGEVGCGKEDVLRVPGSVSDIRRLIEQLETLGAPLQVEQLVNPYTLMSFVKKVLKEEVLTPLVGHTAQSLLGVAIVEAGADSALQVGDGRKGKRKIIGLTLSLLCPAASAAECG